MRRSDTAEALSGVEQSQFGEAGLSPSGGFRTAGIRVISRLSLTAAMSEAFAEMLRKTLKSATAGQEVQ